MRFNKRDESEDPGVQMAPLLDIVFLLLIFFLVTASLKKPHKELPVHVPDAALAAKSKVKINNLENFIEY